MKGKKRRQGIVQAFNAAIEGILYTFKEERNMKIHYFVAAIVLLWCLYLNIEPLEMAMIIFAISLVVVSEMFNTAIEKTIDMVTDDYHPLAKIAKDVAAGGVLIASLNAVVVGYIVLDDKMANMSNNLIFTIRNSEIHITIIGIVLVLISVVVVKTLTSTGTPLKGGMPSGHAALAFCMATIVTLLPEGTNFVISTLSYLTALLVGQSRIEGKIHTFWEVVAGALLGTLIGVLVFQFKIL